MSDPGSSNLSYAAAGVSIDKGNELVRRISKLAKATTRPGVVGGLGGFAALFDIGALDYRQPLLVSAADGVGSKLKIAAEMADHGTIGIDLVAMCANDILVLGAEPLFFLDYFVCESLNVDIAEQVVSGIAKGCDTAGCALLGGETAEHPGTFPPGEYDLSGFCVGIVEKHRLITGDCIEPGDILIGIASSGIHSNGFSLIRKILANSTTSLSTDIDGSRLGELLLTPTRIYVNSILQLCKHVSVKGMAHITGGGLTENVPRIIPAASQAVIRTSSWEQPAVFTWLRKAGGIDGAEMLRTFNCGVGMILVVAADDVDAVIDKLAETGETAWQLGHVESRAAAAGAIIFAD